MQMKRRECKMFSEGSLFESSIKGCVADVTPSVFRQEHNVYRYGLGMMVAGAW
jgi:CRISPR/Cas system CSM-associated protein Csm4 (group 5 of RAMP superfamily)